MKYIAYARKSTDEKDKQVLSIDNQISELKELKRERLKELLVGIQIELLETVSTVEK